MYYFLYTWQKILLFFQLRLEAYKRNTALTWGAGLTHIARSWCSPEEHNFMKHHHQTKSLCGHDGSGQQDHSVIMSEGSSGAMDSTSDFYDHV